jgi:hypothetical protein
MSKRTTEYQEERLRRIKIRKAERRIKRKDKKYCYGKKVCPECGDYMTWCTSCEVWSRTCCEEYGTCKCS